MNNFKFNNLEPLFIGPVSKNTVDSIIELSSSLSNRFVLIPSRRQIDFNYGYVNNWRTREFAGYVRSKTNNILIERDHSGPGQGEKFDDGLESLINDSDAKFDLIHIDPWKTYPDVNKATEITINLINKILDVNKNIYFEVGTEEGIRKYSEEEFEKFLLSLKNSLGDKFKSIKYACIQGGTKLEMNRNIGKFNSSRCSNFIDICDRYGVSSKEHNGDYLSNDEIKEKFLLGLDAINIAPEFGFIESDCILEQIYKRSDINSLNQLFDACLKSKKWEKWIPNYEADKIIKERNDNLIRICGHYLFSTTLVKNIKKKYPGIDTKIKSKIKQRISEVLCAIKQ